jgi:hypothetical protein
VIFQARAYLLKVHRPSLVSGRPARLLDDHVGPLRGDQCRGVEEVCNLDVVTVESSRGDRDGQSGTAAVSAAKVEQQACHPGVAVGVVGSTTSTVDIAL